MDVLVILLLFLISAVLFFVELFLLPGVGLAGIGSAVGLIVANVLVFNTYGLGVGLCVLGFSVVLCLLFLWLLMRSRTLECLSLKQNINSTAASADQLSVRLGEEGVALTRLALVGNALVAGRRVEVRSVDGFIDEGARIVVCGVSQAQILVKRK